MQDYITDYCDCDADYDDFCEMSDIAFLKSLEDED